MEATELRISNLVYHNGEIIEIKSLHPENDDVNDEIPFHSIYGIKITEQWLLDFGYKKIIGHFIILGHLIWCCNDLFMCDKNGIIIEHVHQLQNLYFALNQTELILAP